MRARTPDHLLRAARLNVVSSDLRSKKRSVTSLYGRSKVNRVRKIERRRKTSVAANFLSQIRIRNYTRL